MWLMAHFFNVLCELVKNWQVIKCYSVAYQSHCQNIWLAALEVNKCLSLQLGKDWGTPSWSSLTFQSKLSVWFSLGPHSVWDSAGWSLPLSRHFIGIIWDKKTAWALAVTATALLALLDADLYHGNSNVVSIAFNLFIFLLCFLLIFWHMLSLSNNKAVNGINSWSFKMGSRRLTRAKEMPDFSWQFNLFEVLWKLFLFLLHTGDAQQDQSLQNGM